MAISNELSSEIAAALLAENKTPQELKQLHDVILQVHSTLQKLSADERAERVRGIHVSLNGMDERGSC
jgi:predicted transcriptional regulator